jgi:pimeloyl-ACP methyl ester carboxylesterase
MVEGDRVERVLREWSGPGWPDDETLAMYRAAAQVPFAAHSAMEQLRWLVRSTPRADGRRYLQALSAPIEVPVLQVHGSADRCVPVGAARLTGLHTDLVSDYRFHVVPRAGHFLPEEAPGPVTDLLLGWLGEVTTA